MRIKCSHFISVLKKGILQAGPCDKGGKTTCNSPENHWRWPEIWADKLLISADRFCPHDHRRMNKLKTGNIIARNQKKKFKLKIIIKIHVNAYTHMHMLNNKSLIKK